MNGCFMSQLTHNHTEQQQDAFHQLSGAGVQRTLLQRQWDKGGEGGESVAIWRGMFERWRSLSFFKLVGERRGLNLLFRENGQSKHWRTWPGRPAEQERYCRSGRLNQCSTLLAGDRFQKHLDDTLKGFPTAAAPILNYSLHTCIVSYVPYGYQMFKFISNVSEVYIILLVIVQQSAPHRTPTQLTVTEPNNKEIHGDPPHLQLNVPTAPRWGHSWLETMWSTTLKLHTRRRLRLRSQDASGQQGRPLWEPPQSTEERRQRLKGHVQGRYNYNWHFPS